MSAASTKTPSLLGRLAVKLEMITMEQLRDATAAQGRHPEKRLGEILLELGHLDRAALDKLEKVQRDVVAQWSPLAEMLDALMGPLDEWAFGTLAQSWRSQVSLDAMDLVALPPEERPLATQRIGERASGMATVIMLGRRPG